MLFSLYKATLDDEIRRGLESHEYSEMEIEGVRCKLRRQIEERTRATSGVLALLRLRCHVGDDQEAVPVLIAMLVVEGLARMRRGICRRAASSGSSTRPCGAGIRGSII